MTVKVKVTCACGTEFETTASRIADGRGKFCSRACRYAHAARRSGLTYNIVKVNSAWIRPGQEPWNKGLRGIHASPGTEFKPGEHPSPATEFKRGQTTGEVNFRWAGGPGSRCLDLPGYTALHWLVRR